MTAPSHPARMTGEARRAAILDAARTVFARSGFHGAATAEIAAAAGCSEPMLYKHFGSKQELFAATVDHAGRQVKERVVAALGGSDDPLRALTELSATLIADPRWLELMRMRALAVTMADDPAIAEALRASALHHCTTVAGVLREAQARGQVRADVDPELVGWIGVAIGLLASYRHAIQGDDGLTDTARVMRALLDLLPPEGR